MPVDCEDFFNSINEAQYVWYRVQSNLDKKENAEMLRDIAEHNAMFWNSEGVKQVRDARDNTFKMSNDEFGEMIENTFGRKLDSNNKENITVDKVKSIIEQNSQSLDPYFEMDLDTVAFIPLNKTKV